MYVAETNLIVSYLPTMKHNKVENVCCRDMTKLTQLLLGDNQLTSVHGLEGCNQLYYVQLSHNSITRTGTCIDLNRVHV